MKKRSAKAEHLAGQFSVLGAAFLWSTSGLLIKLIDWHPFVIAGSRSFLAVLFILVIRFIFPPPKGVKNRALPFWGSAIALALTILTFVTANKLTTAANVILLQYTYPVWGALLGWWLAREKPRWEHWGALVFIMSGLYLFFSGGLDSGTLLGNALSILSGVCMGFHTVFLRMLKDGNPRDAMLAAHFLCAVIGLPFIFVEAPVLSATTLLPIFYMGFFQIGLSSLLFSYGIKKIPAIQAMLTSVLDPMLSPLWVFIILGETPSVYALIGGAVIITAVVTSSIIGFKRQGREIV
jgi:drug/metabolite transporter (DMT)-like permease